MRGINRRAFGPNLSNKIRRSRTGTMYECRQCGSFHQLRRDARNCTCDEQEICVECDKRKHTMCPTCKDDGYTICRECCETGPLPCEIYSLVEDDEEMDAESFESDREIETEYFARFGDQRGGKEWGAYNFEWFSGAGDWKPLDEDTTGWDEDDFEEFRIEKEHELVHAMLQNPNSGLYRAIENNQTEATDEEFQTSYQVRDEDGGVRKLDLYFTWGEPFNVEQRIKYYDKEPLLRLQFYADSKKLNPMEKAGISGITSGATIEGLETLLAAEEPPEKDDPLESWMEDYDAEDPSVYWWTKGVIMEKMKDRDLTEDDLTNIIQLVAVNAPMDSITKGMKEAEQLGDKHIWEILKMCAMGRAEILTEQQIHSEMLRDYRSEECNTEGCENEAGYYDKAKTKPIEEGICIDCFMRPSDPEAATELRMMKRWSSEDDYVEMMSCAFCEEFGDGQIPTGVDIDSGDRWSPPTADITGWEMCEYCEGKGEVEDTPENQNIPTWDWDYLIPDEPDYDRYDDRYDDWDAENYYWTDNQDEGEVWSEHESGWAVVVGDDGTIHIEDPYNKIIAEGFPSMEAAKDAVEKVCLKTYTFESETNGDRQLEESIKRTKMSAIRTGLAITTFGIVLWNLWTNHKQEQQISDIMGLV